jgi:YVTN family beta-propeller protein
MHFTGGIDIAALPNAITFKDLLIGSSGFSGEIHAGWSAGSGAGTLFGLDFELESLDFIFNQNVPTDASLRGTINLPFFDQLVNVDISIGVGGGLSAGLSAHQPPGVTASNGLITFTKTGLLEMTLDSIAFDFAGGVFTAKLAGKIKPLAGGLSWPTFDVKELSINSKGEAKIAGGWIDLPKAETLDFHFFKIEITKFGLGRTENGEKYIGFNGSLDLVKGIPAGASVEGLRITWRDGEAPHITMKGVGVEYKIPGTLDFKGEVSYDEPSPGLHAFTGAITLNLPKANKLALDGKVVFGSDLDASGKRFKYFAIYVEGEFGTGIPLWSTGLSLYGIAGLFSVNYAPDRPADWSWYAIDHSKSWFHKPPIGVTDLLRKWAPEEGTLGLGAGAEIATNTDSGYLFNGNFLLLLLFPGPVFMLEGRCNFLKNRPKLGDTQEPDFHSLIVLDTRAGYFLIGLDAKWKYNKEDGKLVEIAGSAEAFFDFNHPQHWYLDIGKKDPLEQRIRATFAGGFQANAYFDLDPKHLALGVWIGKKDHYSYGPVGADLEAWLDANAALSFHPAQFHTDLWLHGRLAVKVFKFRLGLGLDARLDADVFKPFHILGTLQIVIETRIKDFQFDVRLEWGPRPERPLIPEPYKDAGIGHFKSTVEWPLLDGAPPPVVPMDCRPYLTFEFPVHDAIAIGTNPAPDPGAVIIGDPSTGHGSASVHYVLTEVALYKVEGLTSTRVAGKPVLSGEQQLYGSWAAAPPNSGGGGAAAGQNRLMLWAKTPFDLTDDSASWNPWIGDNLPNYPCPVIADEKVCIDWEQLNVGTLVASPWNDPNEPRIVVRWDGGPHPVAGLPQTVAEHHQGILFPAPRKALATAVYVADQSSMDISVIDPITKQVRVAAIQVGWRPYRIAITADGSTIVVLNRGDATLTTIDAATQTITGAPIPVRPDPAGLAIHPNGLKAYVTSYGSDFVCVVDLGLRKVIKEIAVPDRPYAIAILPNGTKAYVSIPPIGVLSVIDLATDTVSGQPIPAVQAMESLLVSPDGSRLYVPAAEGAASNGRVAVLDTTTDHFIDLSYKVGRFPCALAITPDGSRLYVANAFDDTVSVTEITTQPVFTTIPIVTTIPVGKRPFAVAVAPNGASVYVANGDSNDISIIDVATNEVVGSRIAVGTSPTAIAVWPKPTASVIASATFQFGSSGGPSEVFIDVPEGTATVQVVVHEVTAHLKGEVVDPPSASSTIAEPFALFFDAEALGLQEGISRVRIRSDGEWFLLRICITRPATPGGLADVAVVHDQLDHALSVWGDPGAVLAPFAQYRLTAKVSREISGLDALGGWHDTTTFPLDRSFITGGPPGLTDPATSTPGLEDLTRYVAQTVPATLTQPGKRPELTKPVFRAYDIGATFNEDYVDRMYELAGRDLAVQIFDSRNEPARNIEGSLAVLANAWGNAAVVTLSETHKRWMEMLDAASCIPHKVDLNSIPHNKKLAAAEHVLEGDTLYEARFVPLLLRAPHASAADWGDSTWSDVLIRVIVQPIATGIVGLKFRLGSAGHYELTIDAQHGQRTLNLVAGAVTTQLGQSAFAYDANKTYHLSIEAIGSRLRVEQDDEAVFDVDDASFAAGSISLFPWSAGNTHFLDLSVFDFGKGAPVAYRFPFTTSDYVDFFHQIQSFQDETWSAALGASENLASLMVSAIDLSAPASQEEARAYDALAEKLLGPAARQLPTGLEVTRVTQAGAVPALLFRGSEPIDWRRTTLALVQAAASSLPAAVPLGNLKLTSAALGALQLSGDVVTVLLRDAADLTGYRIETLVAEAWVPWYVFDHERRRSAGTRFEVHGGASPLPPAEPGLIPKSANTAGQGQRLPVGAADLRLVAPDGTIEHARRFLPFEAYAPIAVDLMRSADSTGFFLMPSAGSAFGAGTYRAALTYERDKPGIESVLSRSGSTAAERVIIDIPSWADPAPALGQPSFIQSTFGTTGNFEMVAPFGAAGIAYYSRDNDAASPSWRVKTVFGIDAGMVDAVSLIQSSFGNLEVVARIGDRLAHFWRDSATGEWNGPGFFAAGASGTPSLIQGRAGAAPNFELVTPLATGGMAHFWRDNQPFVWTQSTTFAESSGIVSAVSLIQGSFGNLEIVARIGNQLAHLWRDANTQDWSAPDFFAAGVSGTPSFIQGRFGTPGNFEVAVPLAAGIGHFIRNNSEPLFPWSGPNTFGSGIVKSVALIQSNFDQNLELVACVENRLVAYWRESADPFNWFGPAMIGP